MENEQNELVDLEINYKYTEYHEAPDGDPTHFECPICKEQGLSACGKCHKLSSEIEERYSFGIYAGKLCDECCSGFQDNCGLDQPQGSPNDLDETYYDEDDTWN